MGNKTDLRLDRQVTTEEGKALADKWGCAFVECSAKQNVNICTLAGNRSQSLVHSLAHSQRDGCACCQRQPR